MIRCVKCGCSRLDSEGVKCVLCGGSPAVRSEQCHITEDTKAKLLAHAEELKSFGVTVTLEEHRSLEKSVGGLEVFGIALAVADSLNSGVLHKLILFLRDNIRIPKEEILRLRLDEPEQVSDVLRGEESERSSLEWPEPCIAVVSDSGSVIATRFTRSLMVYPGCLATSLVEYLVKTVNRAADVAPG